MKPSRRTLLGWTVVIVMLGGPGVIPALAGSNESADLAAIYAHVPDASFTTLFYLSNTTSATASVNVKCYNDLTQRVGPAAGTTVSLTAFDIDVANPTSLGLTGDPAFNGLGWCYFASANQTEDIAVGFVMGIQGSSPLPGGLPALLASNSSAALGASTAQAQLTDDDANAPMWLGQSWSSFLFILGPRATSTGNVTVNAYNTGGALVGSQTKSVASRDLEIFVFPDFVAGAVHGGADVDRTTGSPPNGGYVGWMYAINTVSLEALLYDLPQDIDDIRALVLLTVRSSSRC